MNTHKELLSECCSAKPLDELAYDNSGRCGDCKEGCMFVAECETSCGINADPADGFGKCTCGAEAVRPTPPSQIEESLGDYLVRQLKEAQELGYVVPENEDLEIGQWMGGLSYQIERKAEELISPERWMIIEGKKYLKADVLEAINKLTKEDS